MLLKVFFISNLKIKKICTCEHLCAMWLGADDTSEVLTRSNNAVEMNNLTYNNLQVTLIKNLNNMLKWTILTTFPQTPSVWTKVIMGHLAILVRLLIKLTPPTGHNKHAADLIEKFKNRTCPIRRNFAFVHLNKMLTTRGPFHKEVRRILSLKNA